MSTMSMTVTERVDIATVAAARRVDLVALAERDGARFQRLHGVEIAGSCPVCGGRDRFHVRRGRAWRDGADRCFCRKCHGDPGNGGRWLDAIDYWRWVHGGSFAEAVRALVGGLVLGAPVAERERAVSPARGEGADACGARADWQRQAAALVERAEARLWADDTMSQRARRWLREERGIDEATARTARLGYFPEPVVEGDLWCPAGIVIPRWVDGRVEAINVRQRPGVTPKYRMVAGSRAKALFGADALARLDLRAVVVFGGEFDALLARRFAADGVACVSFGGESLLPDERWLLALASVPRVVIAMDEDDAGARYRAAWLRALPRAVPAPRLGHKDLTDAWRAGVNVAEWLAQATGVLRWQPPAREDVIAWARAYTTAESRLRALDPDLIDGDDVESAVDAARQLARLWILDAVARGEDPRFARLPDGSLALWAAQ